MAMRHGSAGLGCRRSGTRCCGLMVSSAGRNSTPALPADRLLTFVPSRAVISQRGLIALKAKKPTGRQDWPEATMARPIVTAKLRRIEPTRQLFERSVGGIVGRGNDSQRKCVLRPKKVLTCLNENRTSRGRSKLSSMTFLGKLNFLGLG